jgi:hypothetical protein
MGGEDGERLSRKKERDGRFSPSYKDHSVRVRQLEDKLLYLLEFGVLKMRAPFQANKILAS